MKKLLVLLVAALASFATTSIASDYFDATGIPVQRSTISSAEFRTEFAAIETGISDKLPALTGNGDNWVVVNTGGTALTSITNSAAQTLLGVAIGTDVQAWDTQLDDIAALAVTSNNFIVADGVNWTLETPAQARTSLGLAIGSDLQAWDTQLDDLAALAVTDSNFIVGDGVNWVAETGATVRTSLGLGSIATQAANSVTISGGAITNITDIAVADGGTGSSTAANARTALGLAIGTNVQAWDAQIDDIAALAVTDNNFIVADGANWALEAPAAVRTSLGLVIGTNVQAWTAVLDANTASYTTALNTKLGNIETLADVTDATNVAAAGAPIITTGAGAPGSTPATEGDIYIDTTGDNSWIGTGTTNSADWKQASGAGGGDLLAANNLSDVALASTARTNLGLAIGTDVQAYDADLTTWGGITPSANAQSLVSAATYAAMQALLDLEQGTDFYSIAGANAAFEGIDATILKDADIGVSVQAYDLQLQWLASVSDADSNFIVGSAGGWVGESGATARTSLGAQASDSDLTTIAGLAKTNNYFMVANGSAWALESPASARTSLGLDALALLATVSNTEWAGTDLAVTNGGTGASTAAGAATALGVGTGDSPQFTAVNVGAATDTTLTRDSAGKLAVEGRPMVTMDNAAYTSARIIVTGTTPSDTTGMSSGDIKLVY